MKEHPIIFSGEMVRAVLNGTKFQTRRVIRPQPWHSGQVWKWTKKGCVDDIEEFMRMDRVVWDDRYASIGLPQFCPYGQVGDVLWCRETWRHIVSWGLPGNRDIASLEEWEYNISSWFYVWYKASNLCKGTLLPICDCIEYDKRYLGDKWRPSIHMPKKFARIWLSITDVRVERLQEISEKDIRAEGIEPDMIDSGGSTPWGEWIEVPDYYEPFIHLWDSLNAKRGYGFDTNPWVWVVEFRKQ